MQSHAMPCTQHNTYLLVAAWLGMRLPQRLPQHGQVAGVSRREQLLHGVDLPLLTKQQQQADKPTYFNIRVTTLALA